jgi:dTDP-4-dehydrorhamnose reductase
MVVLVTGASGQLGQALQAMDTAYPEIDFHFADSKQADITQKTQLTTVFNILKPDFCINAAAYTAVDKAESEPEKAQLINVEGAKNLAAVCAGFDCTLIHISTDFVFDGNQSVPYKETDATNPQGVYGQTKRDGELAVASVLKAHIIIRTSWLYSGFGNNFMKTMIRFGNERPGLNVVSDQIGTPTNANDLAEAIVKIMQFQSQSPHPENQFGTYHFSNEGSASWYDFAKAIFENNGISADLKPIPTSGYPTPAKRPKYSVLDKAKIKSTFGISIPEWRESLKNSN